MLLQLSAVGLALPPRPPPTGESNPAATSRSGGGTPVAGVLLALQPFGPATLRTDSAVHSELVAGRGKVAARVRVGAQEGVRGAPPEALRCHLVDNSLAAALRHLPTGASNVWRSIESGRGDGEAEQHARCHEFMQLSRFAALALLCSWILEQLRAQILRGRTSAGGQCEVQGDLQPCVDSCSLRVSGYESGGGVAGAAGKHLVRSCMKPGSTERIVLRRLHAILRGQNF